MSIVLVRIGSTVNPAGDGEIKKMEKALELLKEKESSLDGTTFFVTDHAVEFDHYALNPSNDNRFGDPMLSSESIDYPSDAVLSETEEPVKELNKEVKEREDKEAIQEAVDNLPIVPDIDMGE